VIATVAAGWADGEATAAATPGDGDATATGLPGGPSTGNDPDAFGAGAGVLFVPTTVGAGPPAVGAARGNGAAPETGLACGFATAAGEAPADGEPPATGDTPGCTAGEATDCAADTVAAAPPAPAWAAFEGVAVPPPLVLVCGAHAAAPKARLS
jgi:hypothetical protein